MFFNLLAGSTPRGPRWFPPQKARLYVLWNYSAAGGIHCKWEPAFMFRDHFRRKQWDLNKRKGNASASRCVLRILKRRRVFYFCGSPAGDNLRDVQWEPLLQRRYFQQVEETYEKQIDASVSEDKCSRYSSSRKASLKFHLEISWRGFNRLAQLIYS